MGSGCAASTQESIELKVRVVVSWYANLQDYFSSSRVSRLLGLSRLNIDPLCQVDLWCASDLGSREIQGPPHCADPEWNLGTKMNLGQGSCCIVTRDLGA